MRLYLWFAMMCTWIMLLGCLVHVGCAADPVIVKRNLFSPSRRPEQAVKPDVKQPTPDLAFDDDAVKLLGVSIHGEQRWALLSIHSRLLPDPSDKARRSTSGRNSHGRAPRGGRAASRDVTVLVLKEGERAGEVLLKSVTPDYVVVTRTGKTVQLELYKSDTPEAAAKNLP